MIKLSDYVIKRLEEVGTGHMFMLPGGGAMHLNDSLGNSERIKYVVCLHEQACSIAAEAYARVTNKPGLLMVTTGPGGTNAITGVAGAYIESTPMIVISGQVKRLDQIREQGIRQQGMQEVDIVSIVKPITKYVAMVDEPESIAYHMDRAIYEATTCRPGPVWLDIPLDVQATIIDEQTLERWHPEEKPADITEEKLNSIVVDIIKRLNESERPALLAGNGIRLAEARNEFTRLVEVLDIPVLTTWNGIDLIEEEHPLFFGRPGGMGQRYANFVQQNSDMFISIGARMNLLQTGYNFDGFAPNAYKVMVDIDENELHKINVRPDMPIACDAKRFISCLLAHKDEIKRMGRKPWLEFAQKMKKRYPIVQESYRKQTDKVNTYLLLDTITNQMNGDDVYVSGSSGTCIDVSMQTFRVKRGQRVFCTKGLASMGFGLPASIGAALASGKRTVLVNGDGGFQMNIQELETVRRLNLPIKVFVLCNRGYAQIHATQKNVFAGHYVACDETSELSIPSISDIAKAYKLKTEIIYSNEELADKVAAVLNEDGPVICEVQVSIDLAAQPKQVSFKNEHGQMESMPLQYMNPMLSDEEMKECMPDW